MRGLLAPCTPRQAAKARGAYLCYWAGKVPARHCCEASASNLRIGCANGLLVLILNKMLNAFIERIFLYLNPTNKGKRFGCYSVLFRLTGKARYAS